MPPQRGKGRARIGEISASLMHRVRSADPEGHASSPCRRAPSYVTCVAMAPTKPDKSSKKQPADPEPKAAANKTTSRAHDVLGRLFDGRAGLTAAERKAFSGRFADAACDAMGGRTKSEGVLSDALDWASIMAKALKKQPKALRRYGAARFTWFLDCVQTLADARQGQISGDSAASAKARLERAAKTAKEARADLLETLETLVEGNADAEEKLAKAQGNAENNDALITSLQALAGIGHEWIERADAESKALVESVGLTLGEVQAAEAAASDLTAAAAEKTIEGRVKPNDTPAVNRAEGRVLLEMRAAMKVFARAHERESDVPKLSPGSATRAILAPKTASKSKVKDDASEAPKATEAGGG